MKILTEMSKIEKNKKEEVKVKLVVQKQQYLISLAPLSRMALRSPFHQVKMKMKRQRKKRWLRTDGKRRENEKTEKEKVVENRWQRHRKLKQIKKKRG